MPQPVSAPGSNWAQLKKTLDTAQKANGETSTQELTSKQKKRKQINDFYAEEKRANHAARAAAQRGPGGVGRFMSMEGIAPDSSSPSTIAIPVGQARELVKLLPVPADVVDDPPRYRLVEEMRGMVAGKAILNEAQRAPGNYLAIDCEMVGCGPQGRESALARVSIVNYHGHIVLDTFVSPRETVTDYRTWISGIRRQDLQGAPDFRDIQAQVSKLVEGRTIVGHAIENDMKALLLSHPAPLTRDTQNCKALREKAKTKRPGLKKLSEIELGIQIQSGAHSSVTDARATMALYRLHKVEWEKSLRGVVEAWRAQNGDGADSKGKGKRKRSAEEGEEEGADGDEADEAESGEGQGNGKKGKKGRGEPEQFPGGGRRGISSNIGLVITHRDGTKEVRRGKRGYISDNPGSSSGGGGAGGGGGSGNWWEKSAG